jgi:hypothetical protein
MGLMENWKPVTGAAGRYKVSSLGRVKSLVAPGGEKILSPGKHKKTGHRMVLLAPVPGERKMLYVARLVLEAFVGPCPDGMEGCHNDGDNSNNHLDNLRWDTRSANRLDSVRHGTHQHAKKTHCPRGHEYDRARYRRSGPKAGQSFRACSICENQPRSKH